MTVESEAFWGSTFFVYNLFEQFWYQSEALNVPYLFYNWADKDESAPDEI